MSFRSTARGWVGEHTVSSLLAGSLDRNLYTRFEDIIVPTANGTTQIDHIVVSTFGVFVIETKNVDGWIFGREKDAKWTRVLFEKKWRFQNPLRQNYRHTRALAEFLMLGHSVFHSIVFFIGNCEFKTLMPRRVIKSGLAAYIQEFQRPLLDHNGMVKIVSEIQSLKRNPSLTARSHVATLRQRNRGCV